MTKGSSRKRGRPPTPGLSKDELVVLLRKIAAETSEILNPSKLQKLTGIERRNWNKVQGKIDIINNIRLGQAPSASIKDFPLPNVDESFELYYGKKEAELKKLFTSLINLVQVMWEKSVSFDVMKADYEKQLSQRDRIIDGLHRKLREAREDVEFYKGKYAQVCAESTYPDKRTELGVPNNVVRLPKKEKSALDIDASQLFADLLTANEVIATNSKVTKSKTVPESLNSFQGIKTLEDKTLILMVGYPLSGKSSLANKIVAVNKEFLVVSSDEIRLAMGKSFKDDNESEVWALMQRAVNDLLSKGSRVIIDATNLTKAARHRWSIIANSFNIKPVLIQMQTAPEVCIARNKQLKRMATSRLVTLINSYDKPTLDEGEIYTDDAIKTLLKSGV